VWFARGWTYLEARVSDEPIAQLPLDPVGSLLADRFKIERLIGTGGMASVYRATDTALGRTVAVKLFRADGASSEPERQSGEIALLASLNHFGLVTLFDAGTTMVDGAPRTFIVMELIDGPDLRARIESGPLPSLDVAAMGADLAEALHYVHEQGIIHRDVKPANVLLAPSDFPGRGLHAKLADFGIARLLDQTRLTATGSMLGTASYLSPEQALGASIAAPTDIYSLGLVLLECLTGLRAYPGTAVESAMARLQRQPEIPSALGQDWTKILAAMTAREAADRPAAAEAALLLRSLAHETTDEAVTTLVMPAPTEVMRSAPSPVAAISRSQTSTSPLSEDTPRVQASGRSRTRLLWAGGVVILASFIALGALFLRGGDEQTPVPPSYPAVDGTLGTHLHELQESVNP